jgi:precorrin-6B methylase 1
MDAPNLILMGHGVGDTLQLTVEAQQILARVGKAYVLYLPPSLRRYLKSLRVKCVDLSGRFDENRAFSDVYLDIAELILRRTAEERPVVVLTQGNPLFLNSLNRFLIMQARQRKLSVKVYPSVSPLDVVVCELGLDIATFGLQLFDANRLVSRTQRVNPSVPLLVLQLGGFALEEAGSLDGPDPTAYQPFVAYLARFYPPEHPVTLINIGIRQTARATVPLSRVAELVPHVGATSYLFLDAVRQKQAAQPQQPPTQ